MRIALAQIQSTDNPAVNLRIVQHSACQAADAGATMVVLPEATMCRFGVPLHDIAEPVNGRWADHVRATAERTGTAIAVGMFTPGITDKVFSTLLLVGRGADHHYNKIHLYDAFGARESSVLCAGSDLACVTVDDISVGLTICYDVRFPSMYAELGRKGAQVILISASWADGPGKGSQWELLTRARAADSTCFVLACDQAMPARDVYRSNSAQGIGKSLVASPYGDIIAIAGPEHELLLVDIDPESVAHTREQLPILDPHYQ